MKESTEVLANELLSYLFRRYPKVLHVRRVASWIGFVVGAVDKLPGSSPGLRRTRQVGFRYKGRAFKIRYDHHAGQRGGLHIVEVLPGKGAPEGPVIISITTLSEAEEIYNSLQQKLDGFIALE
jgi:hypothetical protein